MQNALDIFLNQKRFDLIFKWLYLQYPDNNFIKESYLESIRAFNNFYEENPSDNIKKEGPDAFIKRFEELFTSIKKTGFISNNHSIPIGNNNEISDGAHRLTICAFLNLQIATQKDNSDELYDYIFFRRKMMDSKIMDFGALQYVKLNPNAYIVHIHSIVDMNKDNQICNLLNSYGFIYYQKNIYLNFNGYVNLKKISYGIYGEKENWIGDNKNNFMGAQEHAKLSLGKNPMRVFIFVCSSFDKILKVKQEIRKLLDMGNHSIHINDKKEEAITLAKIYFNDNSLNMINYRSFKYESKLLDTRIQKLSKIAAEHDISIEDMCACGSTPLNVYGLRESNDFDFIAKTNSKKILNIQDSDLSNHESELYLYPNSKQEIIENPNFHFYYNNFKFISLDILYKMKKKRNEKPKDIQDCKLIKKALKGRNAWSDFKIYSKKKYGLRREIILFNCIKFYYTKKKKQ
ncbi:hypothetical protein [Campylobacter jejuni]|uniref:hypothetical protein n=1 Tax=Campylobacter jejuni TaxID=197 RepID=UPI000F8134E8|nr:hypothetical protein [Campylobacter jejuni]RTJ71573.1 hypothetical protein C3H60_02525 [Campylobacter jejuni]